MADVHIQDAGMLVKACLSQCLERFDHAVQL